MTSGINEPDRPLVSHEFAASGVQEALQHASNEALCLEAKFDE